MPAATSPAKSRLPVDPLLWQVRVSNFGGPSELKTETIQRPEVGPGEVLVRVVAAGVNPVETYKRAVNP